MKRSLAILWVLLSSVYILTTELTNKPNDIEAVVISKGFKCNSDSSCTVLVKDNNITENTNAKYIANVRPVGDNKTVKIEITREQYNEYTINERYKFDKPSYNIFLGYDNQSVATPDFATVFTVIRLVNLLVIILCFCPSLVLLALEAI